MYCHIHLISFIYLEYLHISTIIYLFLFVYLLNLFAKKQTSAIVWNKYETTARIRVAARNTPENMITYADPWLKPTITNGWAILPCCRSPRWRSAGHPWRSHSTAQAPRGCRPCLESSSLKAWCNMHWLRTMVDLITTNVWLMYDYYYITYDY